MPSVLLFGQGRSLAAATTAAARPSREMPPTALASVAAAGRSATSPLVPGAVAVPAPLRSTSALPSMACHALALRSAGIASCSSRTEPLISSGMDGSKRREQRRRRRRNDVAIHRRTPTSAVAAAAASPSSSSSSGGVGSSSNEPVASPPAKQEKKTMTAAGGNGSSSSSSSESLPPKTPADVAELLARSAQLLRRQEEVAKLQAETAKELARALAEARSAAASGAASGDSVAFARATREVAKGRRDTAAAATAAAAAAQAQAPTSTSSTTSPSTPPSPPAPTVVIPPALDARARGEFDARFHSTSSSATPRDLRVLPRRIVLVRHAESEGNVDSHAYTYMPDPQVPLTHRGLQQAVEAGRAIREMFDGDYEDGYFPLNSSSRIVSSAVKPSSAADYRLHFYMSPYKRSRQTCEAIASAFPRGVVNRIQEDVQLREQDFGNFQDAAGKEREKAERLRFGRFFYRFPNGESGADVYDRMTLFEDHLVRDINAGRFSAGTSLVLVTHGLALRIFLMRWFHWTVADFLQCYNPPNAAPVVLERTISPIAPDGCFDSVDCALDDPSSVRVHTKALYRLSRSSRSVLKGCTEEMCYVN